MCLFEDRGKPEYLEKNLLEQSREPTTNSTLATAGLEIESGPHWWEASALTMHCTIPTPLRQSFKPFQFLQGVATYTLHRQ